MNKKLANFHLLRFALVILSVFVLALLPRQVLAVDLNEADGTQLQALPGIGPKTAEMIIHERERGGAFTSLEDLSDRVRGIGPKKLEALQEAGLRVDDKPSAQQLTHNPQ